MKKRCLILFIILLYLSYTTIRGTYIKNNFPHNTLDINDSANRYYRLDSDVTYYIAITRSPLDYFMAYDLPSGSAVYVFDGNGKVIDARMEMEDDNDQEIFKLWNLKLYVPISVNDMPLELKKRLE